jgi:transposase
MDLNSAQRSQILALATHTTQSMREIARNVACSLATVSRLLKQHRTTGNMEPSRKGNCGRQRLIGQRLSNHIARLGKNDPTKTAREIKDRIGIPANHVSVRRMREHLQQIGRIASSSKSSSYDRSG